MQSGGMVGFTHSLFSDDFSSLLHVCYARLASAVSRHNAWLLLLSVPVTAERAKHQRMCNVAVVRSCKLVGERVEALASIKANWPVAMP